MQSMLLSLVPGKNMAAISGIYLKLGLQLSNSKLESCPVELTYIGQVLSAAKIRGSFPKHLTKFFLQPDSLKYFSVSKAGTPRTAVTLRIGDLVADHKRRARPSASANNAHRVAFKGPQACRTIPLCAAKRPQSKAQSSAALTNSGVAAASGGPKVSVILVTTAVEARVAHAAISSHRRIAVNCEGCNLSRSGRLCLVQVRCAGPGCAHWWCTL